MVTLRTQIHYVPECQCVANKAFSQSFIMSLDCPSSGREMNYNTIATGGQYTG